MQNVFTPRNISQTNSPSPKLTGHKHPSDSLYENRIYPPNDFRMLRGSPFAAIAEHKGLPCPFRGGVATF